MDVGRVLVEVRKLPIRPAEVGEVAEVVFRGRAPERGPYAAAQQLAERRAQGTQLSRLPPDQPERAAEVCPRVAVAANERHGGRHGEGRGTAQNSLPEADFAAGRRPFALRRCLGAALEDPLRAVRRKSVCRHGQREGLRLPRQNFFCEGPVPDGQAVSQQTPAEAEVGSVGEKAAVFDRHAVGRAGNFDGAVEKFRLRELRGRRAVGKEQAVRAKASVRRVGKIIAAAETDDAVGALFPQLLIDEIPDEAALILLIFFRQRCVKLEVPERISHRVGVFTGEKRLCRLRLQIFLDFLRLCVHAALNVARLRVARVHEDALVVDEARVVPRAQPRGEVAQNRAAEGFVAAGPEQDAGVVFVPLDHRGRPVKDRAAPLVPIPGERVRAAVFDLALHHPAAVRLKVRLVDDVQAVTVAELVKTALVRIVRGTHGVEIVLLQKLQVAFDFIARDGAAPVAGKLVPVDAAKDETLAV